jgi:adenylate cyclase
MQRGGTQRRVMGVEIERKFLLRNDEWQNLTTTHASIRQAYLASGGQSSTRVRIRNGTEATVTIKSIKAEVRRLEVECRISVADAEALLALRTSGLVVKTRYTIPWGKRRWEIDVFAGDNTGLVMAEIELGDEREPFERPPWLGVEVTGQQQYYNGSLARHPFCHWAAPACAEAASAESCPTPQKSRENRT